MNHMNHMNRLDACGALLAAKWTANTQELCAIVESIGKESWQHIRAMDHLHGALFFTKRPNHDVFLETALRALMSCRLAGGGRFGFHLYYGRWLLSIMWPNGGASTTSDLFHPHMHAFAKTWMAEEERWRRGRVAWLAASARFLNG